MIKLCKCREIRRLGEKKVAEAERDRMLCLRSFLVGKNDK